MRNASVKHCQTRCIGTSHARAFALKWFPTITPGRPSDAYALDRRRPRAASRRARPADAAPPQGNKSDVLDTIRRMAQLQIDTIHVVARSPYLVLFSRLGDFSPQWLDEHLAEARLFEYWSHEACFLPVEQFGLMRYKMLDPSGMGWKYAAEWHEQNRPDIERLLARIRAEARYGRPISPARMA